MKKHRAGLCLMLAELMLAVVALPAWAAEKAPSWPQAYRAVMQAQYAARAQPPPSRPEESQKIYDTYLQSIGRPKDQPDKTTATSPSH